MPLIACKPQGEQGVTGRYGETARHPQQHNHDTAEDATIAHSDLISNYSADQVRVCAHVLWLLVCADTFMTHM